MGEKELRLAFVEKIQENLHIIHVKRLGCPLLDEKKTGEKVVGKKGWDERIRSWAELVQGLLAEIVQNVCPWGRQLANVSTRIVKDLLGRGARECLSTGADSFKVLLCCRHVDTISTGKGTEHVFCTSTFRRLLCTTLDIASSQSIVHIIYIFTFRACHSTFFFFNVPSRSRGPFIPDDDHFKLLSWEEKRSPE